MALVNVTNIRLLNNPCPILSPFVFEISFEALAPLQHDLEWRVVYVGSSQCGSSRSSRNRSSSDEAKVTKKVRENSSDKISACTPQQSQSSEEKEADQKQPQKSTVEPASSPSSLEGESSSAASPAARSQADQKRSNATVAEVNYSEELAEGEAGDYLLDAVLLGPIEEGVLAFEFAVNPPAYETMDPGSVVGMQAVLVCALYKQQEFIRIGYYLNNAYSEITLRENPPDIPIYEKLVRCIVEEPRVTRFPIRWDESSSLLLQEQHEESEQQQTEEGVLLLQEHRQQKPQKAEQSEELQETQQPVTASPPPEHRKKLQQGLRQTEPEAQQQSPQQPKKSQEEKKKQEPLQSSSQAAAEQLLPLPELEKPRLFSPQWAQQELRQPQPVAQSAVQQQQDPRCVEDETSSDAPATASAAAVACSEVAA